MAEQLPFDLTTRPAHGREDFFVTPANALAVALVDGWQSWPSGKLALIGPAGSGKTHLAHVWAADSSATVIAARDLAQADVPMLAQGPVCVEDVPGIAADRCAQEALFHLHNLAQVQRQPLLVTGIGAPAQWPLTLPDLASRLQSAPLAELSPPDDTLLGAVLLKLFGDRQLTPEKRVVPYLVRHMPRSFDMARKVVAAMDAMALSRRRPITLPIATEVLQSLDTGDGAA